MASLKCCCRTDGCTDTFTRGLGVSGTLRTELGSESVGWQLGGNPLQAQHEAELSGNGMATTYPIRIGGGNYPFSNIQSKYYAARSQYFDDNAFEFLFPVTGVRHFKGLTTTLQVDLAAWLWALRYDQNGEYESLVTFEDGIETPNARAVAYQFLVADQGSAQTWSPLHAVQSIDSVITFRQGNFDVSSTDPPSDPSTVTVTHSASVSSLVGKRIACDVWFQFDALTTAFIAYNQANGPPGALPGVSPWDQFVRHLSIWFSFDEVGASIINHKYSDLSVSGLEYMPKLNTAQQTFKLTASNTPTTSAGHTSLAEFTFASVGQCSAYEERTESVIFQEDQVVESWRFNYGQPWPELLHEISPEAGAFHPGGVAYRPLTWDGITPTTFYQHSQLSPLRNGAYYRTPVIASSSTYQNHPATYEVEIVST